MRENSDKRKYVVPTKLIITVVGCSKDTIYSARNGRRGKNQYTAVKSAAIKYVEDKYCEEMANFEQSFIKKMKAVIGEMPKSK